MTRDTAPEALLVMGREVFEQQFDAERLERLGSLVSLGDEPWADSYDDPSVAARLADVEVLITSWGAPHLDEEALDRMPRLRAVLHAAGTIRHLVSDTFWERGIRATTAAEANAVPVAEYTLAAIIFSGKKVPFIAADPQARRSVWMQQRSYGALSNLGLTIGVVGFSRVGRMVVERVQQLQDVTCLVADPHVDPEVVRAAGGVVTPLEEMLPRLDVLTIHAPELPSTRHMIGAVELAALPDHATVINTARGSLVDTAALERECAAGRLNAILDVTDPEPLPDDSPLYSLPNVMVSPHLAGSLGSELLRMADSVLDELERYVEGLSFLDEATSEGLRLSA